MIDPQQRTAQQPYTVRTRRVGGGCGNALSGCGLVVLLLLGAAVFLIVRTCSSIDKLSEAVANASLVQTTVSTTLTNALGDLRPQGGMIVGWRTIDTRVKLDRETSIDAFGYKIPIGAVHLTLDVPGNRVQYLIPIDGTWLAKAAGEDTVILTLPAPIANEHVVEVQSDPSKFALQIDNDFAEHLIPSGGDVDAAKRLLRDSVLESARSRPALAEVRMDARRQAQQFFGDLFEKATGRPLGVVVTFADEVGAGEGR